MNEQAQDRAVASLPVVGDAPVDVSEMLMCHAERLVEIAQELQQSSMPLQTVVNISVRELAELAREALYVRKAIAKAGAA